MICRGSTVIPCSPVISHLFEKGCTHGVLDFVDDGLAGCFDAEVRSHVGDVVCCRAGSNDTFCVHDFSESVTFCEEMVMSWFIVELTDYGPRDRWDTLILVKLQEEIP